MDSKEALFRLLVWFLYFNGVGVHILISALGSIKATSNSVVSFRGWWDHNWETLRIRVFVDAACLIVWYIAPQVLGQVIGHVFPITYGTAGIMGIAVDRVIAGLGFSFGWGPDMGKVAPNGHS